MRTTLVLGLANEPGSLVRALRVLAEGGLNMSKLESRPLRGRAWQYVFWIDLDADAEEPGSPRRSGDSAGPSRSCGCSAATRGPRPPDRPGRCQGSSSEPDITGTVRPVRRTLRGWPSE